eukprot:m.680998 g.680998  ORF g.680998 m.680998 type:complete len:575 (+) comp58597_c2_seq18:500-2224(+)
MATDDVIEITPSSTKANVLGFQNIVYSIEALKEHSKEKFTRTILRGVSGYALGGEIFAILGSSGAGKTTLLDCLTLRKTKGVGQLTGDVTLNGAPLDPEIFRHMSAYVLQEDMLLGTLTAGESMAFSARLRLPHVAEDVRKQRIASLIADMALERTTETMVGSEGIRGLSGGEKKRLAIALQLLADPYVLFLDEPTTGLDSYNSQMVMEQVQKLARKSGKIVVCSIHQPRATIFQLFDRVMLMSRGQVTYFGPTPGALDAFAKVGFACPELENPADFVIDVIVRHEWANDFEPLDRLVLQAKEQFESEGIPVNTFAVQRRASKIREAEKSHGLQHYLTLTHRTFLATLRNPAATFVQLTQTIFIACLLGSIYYKLGHNQASIQDRSGLLFFIIMNQVFSYFPTISLFAEVGSITIKASTIFFLFSRVCFCLGRTVWFLAVSALRACTRQCRSFWPKSLWRFHSSLASLRSTPASSISWWISSWTLGSFSSTTLPVVCVAWWRSPSSLSSERLPRTSKWRRFLRLFPSPCSLSWGNLSLRAELLAGRSWNPPCFFPCCSEGSMSTATRYPTTLCG